MDGELRIKFKDRVTSFLGVIEDAIYVVLAILLVAVAVLVLIAAGGALVQAVRGGDLIAGVVDVIDKVLLALMVAEILYTVVISLRSHALQAKPFIIVGLIAAVRRVLLISLEAAHVSAIESPKFTNYMIELGVLSVLILIFVISLHVFRKQNTPGFEQGSYKSEERD